jgi:Leucine-rich repeat (LRR) protein
LQAKAKGIKTLSFKKFGLNWGIWHYDLGALFEGFENLEEIDLSYNYIDTVIIDFSKLKKLIKIDLSHNALYYWGQEGSFRIHEQLAAPNLEMLNLSYGICGFIDIGQQAVWRNSLRWLDLSGNYFSGISFFREDKTPPILRISPLPNLEYLALRDNYYQYVPKIRHFENLQKIDLSGNPIRCNFEELLHFKKLQHLFLRSLGLQKIPKALFQLEQLLVLELQGNALPPAELKKLQLALPNTKIITD